jgi:dolichol-phosphate mannosyltransferase
MFDAHWEKIGRHPGQLIRFCLVGAAGTLVNLMVLFICVHWAGLSPLLGAAIAIELSIINNFFLNHHYTFRKLRRGQPENSRSLARKLVRYNTVALGGALITYAAFWCFYGYIGLHYLLADILAIAVATGWNYWMSLRIVWRIVDKPDRPATGETA